MASKYGWRPAIALKIPCIVRHSHCAAVQRDQNKSGLPRLPIWSLRRFTDRLVFVEGDVDLSFIAVSLKRLLSSLEIRFDPLASSHQGARSFNTPAMTPYDPHSPYGQHGHAVRIRHSDSLPQHPAGTVPRRINATAFSVTTNIVACPWQAPERWSELYKQGIRDKKLEAHLLAEERRYKDHFAEAGKPFKARAHKVPMDQAKQLFGQLRSLLGWDASGAPVRSRKRSGRTQFRFVAELPADITPHARLAIVQDFCGKLERLETNDKGALVGMMYTAVTRLESREHLISTPPRRRTENQALRLRTRSWISGRSRSNHRR